MVEKIKENFLNALKIIGGYGYFVTIYLASYTSQYIIYRYEGIGTFREKYDSLFIFNYTKEISYILFIIVVIILIDSLGLIGILINYLINDVLKINISLEKELIVKEFLIFITIERMIGIKYNISILIENIDVIFFTWFIASIIDLKDFLKKINNFKEDETWYNYGIILLFFRFLLFFVIICKIVSIPI